MKTKQKTKINRSQKIKKNKIDKTENALQQRLLEL